MYLSYRQIARIVFLALALLCAGTATAQQNRQTGKLFGVVTDRAAKTPLYGASVSVADTKLGIMADENGRYVIDQIPPGTYNIRFSMIGYKTLVKTDVTITPGRETEISVSLDQDAIEVEGVVVQTKSPISRKIPRPRYRTDLDTSEILRLRRNGRCSEGGPGAAIGGIRLRSVQRDHCPRRQL